MVKTDWRSRFTDISEGTLTEEEQKEFSQACASDRELQSAWKEFQDIVALEHRIGAQQFRAPAHLQVKVMERIEQEKIGLFRRLFMNGMKLNKALVGSLATVALLVVTVRIAREGAEEARLEVLGGAKAPSVIYNDEEIKSVTQAPPAPLEKDKSQRESRIDAVKVDKKLAQSSNLQPAAPPASRLMNEMVMGDSASNIAAAGKINAMADGISSEAGYGCYGCEIPFPRATGSTEQYIHYGENQRVSPREQPLSTFSIDVDTGSYTNVRRMILRQGMLPPPDSVRIEEFLNYFSYQYPQQYEKPFAVHSEMAISPLESGKYLLKLGVKARDSKPNEKPWNLVFLVDISGSMSDQDKLPLARAALKYLVSQMRQNDRISIVTYAGNAGIALPSTTTNNREEINAAIDRLGAGGSTNGSGGITMAYQIAEQSRIAGGVNRVVLVTDGDFNVGVTSHDELIRMIETKRESGVTLTTIGVGTGNINDGMMEQLANKGNGNYFYLDSFKEAQKVFGSDLFGTMQVVAKDVKIQVEFNPAAVAQYRLIGYENRKLRDEDFANDRIDAGEIGSGHTVTALYEVILTGTTLAESLGTQLRYQQSATPAPDASVVRPEEIGFVKMRFKTPDGSSSELTEFPLVRGSLLEADSRGTEDLRFAAAVAYLGQILRKSQFVGGYSLPQVAELAQGAIGKDPEGARQEFVQLVRSAAALAVAR